jgi:hypothetical protein
MANAKHKGELTVKTQSELLSEAVKQLYEYITNIDEATHNDRRPGMGWHRPEGIETKSCGAFRKWAIYAVYDRIAISADAFRVREGYTDYCGLWIHTGGGKIVFPRDDSRSHHSLSLSVVGGEGKLVNVTKEDGPWTKHLPVMTERLRLAIESIKAEVVNYDNRVRAAKDNARQQELAEAMAALEEKKN